MNAHPGRTKEERAYYSLNHAAYRVFAPFYDLVTRPMRRLRGEVAGVLPLDRRMRVLDVATGTGAQAQALGERAGEVIGIDLSESMLRVARRKNRLANVTFQRANATELPFADRSFDASCVSFALHEMPLSIREQVVREMARVTKPGGAIAVVDYGLPSNAVARWAVYHFVKLYEPYSYVEFMRSDVRALLRTAGIVVDAQRQALHGTAVIFSGHRDEVVATAAPQTQNAFGTTGA